MVNTGAVVAAATVLVVTLAYCAPTNSNPRGSWPMQRASRMSEGEAGSGGGGGGGGAGAVEARNATWLGPREEARALCSVRTPEGNATANVTISRRLHGVLTPREMHTAIHRLEVIIHGQMLQLRHSLDAIRSQLASSASSATGAGASAPYPERSKFLYQYYVPAAGYS